MHAFGRFCAWSLLLLSWFGPGLAAGQPSDADAPPLEVDASVPPDEDDSNNDAPTPEPPPRGDTPVSPESVFNPEAAQPAQPPAAPSDSTDRGPAVPTDAGAPTASDAARPQPGPTPSEPCGTRPCATLRSEPRQTLSSSAPMILWATADWAGALGPARCGPEGLEGADLAIRIASTLQRSAAAAGVGIAVAGALGDHPLIAYAAKEQPELLADLLVQAGFSALAVGIADMNGPLLRNPRLASALQSRGVPVIASNLECGAQAWCQTWATAEDPLPILERDGRRYALIAVLPDDLLGRVELAAGRRFGLHSAAETLIERTRQARAAGVELIVASIDHGPDATAAINLGNFVAQLPPEIRPDLLLSPSSAESLLFLRPLDVHPAVVGTRSGALLGLRVTRLPETHDSDVFARSVRLNDWNDNFSLRLAQLGASFCRARGTPLPGGQLDAPLSADELVSLGAGAARQLADADLALVDPLVYDRSFSQPKSVRLQRGQMERAVVLDSPLVVAHVSLDWLANLNKLLTGLRPLTLIGTGSDRGDPLIAGRIPVTGALYRIVTSAVLARSGRLPDGAKWTPLEAAAATLRGALLAQLDVAAANDPRNRLLDPAQRTQWVLRADGQLQANLTAVQNPGRYEEPALAVNDSRQLGSRLVLNYDADAPRFLFENAVQVAFDRNFATRTTAQDLAFLQTTYTYRGLWPHPLGYPHPFVEGYVETQFNKGNAPYHHLLLRPEAGLRSMVSRTLSLKLSAGFQYEALDPNAKIFPGVGAEIVLKPSSFALSNGLLQLEGNITYYWSAPGNRDQHTLRGQLISSIQLIGPLQFTLTALALIRKDRHLELSKGLGVQAGIRLRFVERTMSD
jgi:hypothetical protein